MTSPPTMLQNPLKALRLNYGYTQQQLADKLGITRQIVLDLEQGMYSQPPPSVINYLCQYDKSAISACREAYALFVTSSRGQPHVLRALQMVTEPPKTFAGWIGSVAGSTRGFCRTIIIQRSIVTSYIAKGHRWADIALALRECGLSESYIELLSGLPRE